MKHYCDNKQLIHDTHILKSVVAHCVLLIAIYKVALNLLFFLSLLLEVSKAQIFSFSIYIHPCYRHFVWVLSC